MTRNLVARLMDISAKETVNFKTTIFFVSKSKMPKYMCEYMESEKV